MLDACANNKNHLIELQEKINKFMQNVFDINGEDKKDIIRTIKKKKDDP